MKHESATQSLFEQLKTSVGKVIAGKENVVEQLLIALLAGGHVLIEDVPGVGKTTMVAAFARSLALSFRRIQFTPDLMPTDITGFHLYDQERKGFVFRQGAVMAHLVLADEINRTSPRTQSALLEVMQEQQVTVDGQTFPLPKPFMVLATQNPVEFAGTFPLPEAQLDRFMLKISMGYPSEEEEIAILDLNAKERLETAVLPIMGEDELRRLRDGSRSPEIAYPLQKYIVELCRRTREHPSLALGASPRASQMLAQASKAKALLAGRSFVLPDDIQALVRPVLLHRLTLTPQARLSHTRPEDILEAVLADVPVPRS